MTKNKWWLSRWAIASFTSAVVFGLSLSISAISAFVFACIARHGEFCGRAVVASLGCLAIARIALYAHEFSGIKLKAVIWVTIQMLEGGNDSEQ